MLTAEQAVCYIVPEYQNLSELSLSAVSLYHVRRMHSTLTFRKGKLFHGGLSGRKGFPHGICVFPRRKKGSSAVSSALRKQILKIPFHRHEPSLCYFCGAVIFHEIKDLFQEIG